MANFRRGDLVVLRGCTKGTVYKVVKRSVINPNEWIIISGGCCEFVRGSVLEGYSGGGVGDWHHCQLEIEGNSECKDQCSHCGDY